MAILISYQPIFVNNLSIYQFEKNGCKFEVYSYSQRKKNESLLKPKKPDIKQCNANKLIAYEIQFKEN